MTKNETLSKEVLLRLSTMLANGEILFVCNRVDLKTWIQAYAFYVYSDSLYVVTKDFTGIFRWASPSPNDQFVACSSHHLFSYCTIIDIKGNVIATCNDHEWTFAPPDTKLHNEFACQIQCNEDIHQDSDGTGNKGDENHFDPPQRMTNNNLYRWFRRIFTNKSPAVG